MIRAQAGSRQEDSPARIDQLPGPLHHPLEDIGNLRTIEMRFKQGVRLPEPAGVAP
jgi:hypothetical protein